MESNRQKALQELFDGLINSLENENRSTATASASLAAKNQRLRHKLSTLNMKINARKPAQLLPKVHLNCDPSWGGNSIREKLEKLILVASQRKEFYEQQTDAIRDCRQKQQREHTMMSYHEVEAAIAAVRSATAVAVREKQCLHAAKLAERAALHQQLKEMQLQAKTLEQLLQEQRISLVEAGRALANLNFDIDQLKAEAELRTDKI